MAGVADLEQDVTAWLHIRGGEAVLALTSSAVLDSMVSCRLWAWHRGH